LKKIGITAEIISADSRQVYRGLDLLSGKVTKKEMSGIKHHMLDVVSLKKAFSVSDYQKQTKKIIRQIYDRGNMPILVGGTGFYIDAVVNDFVLPA
jgi:tRNA dimethylallyltransferase